MPPKRTVKIDGSDSPAPLAPGSRKNGVCEKKGIPNTKGNKESFLPTKIACKQAPKNPDPESVFIPSRKNNRDPPVEERELTQNSYRIKKSGGYNTLRYNFSNNKIV